jgi:hypothetical protein
MRSRNIKPGFFENEELAQLPYEARLLFAGLWCYSDREGRFEWRPKRIKALLFPYDDIDITCHLMSLHVMTLILQYKLGDDTFGVIPNFKKHQHPHPHEACSTLPDPNECELILPNENNVMKCVTNVIQCQADIMIPDTRGTSSSEVFDADSEEMRLSVLLRDLINLRSDNEKPIVPPKTNMKTWAKQIDYIHRIDSRSYKEIESIIRWSQSDPFWQNNIHSTGKLREKFTQLILKSKNMKPEPPRQPSMYRTITPDPEYDKRYLEQIGEA